MELFWDFILVVGALCVATILVGLTAMAITACLGQTAENIDWIKRVLL